MPWLLSEDAALKAKIQGLTVTDANAPPGGRAVPVRFRLPEDELATLSYPIFVIEHQGQTYAADRDHRGYIQLPYAPEGLPMWYGDGTGADVSQSPYYANFPVPWNFDYKITLYARYWSVHVQPLLALLATEAYLHPKFAYLNVPQDGTVRSMFVIGGPEDGYGKDEDGKRIFSVTWLVRVYSELPENVLSTQAFGGTLIPVSAVDLDLGVYGDIANIDLTTPAEIEQNRGILNVGMLTSFNANTSPT